MASFRKSGTGWRAEVCKAGQRKSATFSTKTEAAAWATSIEADILAGKLGKIPNKTFGQLLERYRDEVSPSKKGERWERMRINLVLRDRIASIKLADLRQPAFQEWRDRRLKSVTPASVRREWNLLTSACNVALKEWHWLKDHPMKGVKVPKHGKPRERVATQDELDKLAIALGYDRDIEPRSIGARVGAAMLFAVETAMRAGEIAALQWSDVTLHKRILRVAGHSGGGKTDAAIRNVPLSAEAIRLLQQMEEGEGGVFQLTSMQISSNFLQAKKRAGVNGLTFHDMRHTAITRLSKKVDVRDLARAVGHRDLNQLMDYYNESAEEIAGRL